MKSEDRISIFSINALNREISRTIENNRSKKALLSGEEYLLRHTAGGVIVFDSSRNIINVNGRMCGILGYSRDELLSRPLKDITSHKDLQTASAEISRLLSGEIDEFNLELRYIRKDGCEIWVRTSGLPFLEKGKNRGLWILASEEISERKRAEDALIIAENQYHYLFETSRYGILLIDAETGKILDMNSFLVNMSGYSREQFIGKVIWETGFFKDIAENRNGFLKLIKEEHFRYDDVPFEKADGKQINVEFISNVYASDNQKIIQCDIRDITERKLVEETRKTLQKLRVHQVELRMQNEELRQVQIELDTSRARYFDLYDLAPVGYCTLGDKGQILESNFTAATMLGLARGEMINQMITRFIFNKDQDIYYMLRKQLFETGKPQACELRMFHNNGTSFWVHLAAALAQDVSSSPGQSPVSGPVCRIVLTVITERKRIEEELTISEIRYRRLFETAQSGILILDAETGKIMNVNPFLIEMLGYSEEQFIEKAIWEIGLFKDIAANRDNFLELQEKKYIRYEDLPLETADGRKIDVEFISNVYSVDNHKVIQCDIRDISERKRIEDEFAISEIRYRRLFETAQSGILILDAETGKIVNVNPFLIEMLGYSEEQFIEKAIWEIGLFKDIAANRDNFLELQEKKYIRYEDLPLETADGRRIDVEFISNVYSVDNHKVIQCDIRDISERKRVEDELNASEIRYRRLFETAQDGILILDAQSGKIMDVNPFLIKMLGYSREQFIEKAIWEIGLFKNIAASQENFLELLEKEYIRYEDLPLETADGRQINVEFISNVYSVNNYSVIQCNIRDITDRKRAEEAAKKLDIDLSRSNRDLEQFAYVASHDLQEPLRAVAGFVGMLRKEFGAGLDARAHEYIDMAIEGAERMRRLIQDLLAFSRVGIKGRTPSLMKMQDAFDAAVRNLSVAIMESNAVVKAGPLPVVNADLTQMTQLLQNLISNAIKFRRLETLEIRVEAEKEKGEWVFSVSDNGIGIEPQYYERIFLIFQRLHSRAEYEGTGLGLALCKKIVERHEGSIRVESVPGKGSTFYFTIPDRGDNK